MITRRSLIATSMIGAPALLILPAEAADRRRDIREALVALERRHGGRLGVAIMDTGSRRKITHRADERFPFLSTFKFLAAALVLARVDQGKEKLDRRVTYGKDSLVTYSPVTEKFAGDAGMTIGEICHAAVTLSDNTAGNLLFDSFGGPAGLTAFARSLGDKVTRSDRREPTLNEATPGDPRDTTTPLAMLELMRKTLTGTALSRSSRQQLGAWLVATTTGGKRLRAGAPAGWIAGDKTGTGPNGLTNDVAIFWPPRRNPVLVTAYYEGASGSADERNAVIAEVGKLAASSLRA